VTASAPSRATTGEQAEDITDEQRGARLIAGTLATELDLDEWTGLDSILAVWAHEGEAEDVQESALLPGCGEEGHRQQQTRT
jgi:hypothetical protein